MSQPTETITAGGALLARLKVVGVDYIFANSGTDFPPIIEGLAEAAAKDIALPRAIVIPHEHAAMGMAHGYYLATGRAQAVMAHTNVGLANCAIGAINAATEHVPVLLFSGRTPATERGPPRTRPTPPRRADRLGPGNARPDRPGQRIGQVGLRAEVSRAGGGGGGSRIRDRVLDP